MRVEVPLTGAPGGDCDGDCSTAPSCISTAVPSLAPPPGLAGCPIGDDGSVTTSSSPAARPFRRARADAVCVAAVDVAKDALTDLTDAGDVGERLGHVVEGDRLVSHTFACTRPGYRGWRWSVTVTRAPRQRTVTVDETVLLPGPDAVVSPAWVPYLERLQSGDVGPGDVLPTSEDDLRLVPTWLAGDEAVDAMRDDTSVRPVVDEIGLGRIRVLSLEGRDEAAQRWYDGESGPRAAVAEAAPHPCRTCGFLVRLAGPLSTVFGVCANEVATDDGRVVSYDHGCGAHSQVSLSKAAQPPSLPPLVFDTVAVDEFGAG